MNSIKKARSLDTFPRARKRNSTGSKPASQASQRRASLLKNNKNLALTLEETRCELSIYKNLYEECLECINKTKFAKSRMMQFSTTLKNLVKAIDENIILLDFDESKWLDIKGPSQSNKNFQNGMNPVIEAFNEVLEEDFVDQEVDCNQRINSEYSDQIGQSNLHPPDTLEKATDAKKCYDPKRTSMSPRKKSENLVESKMNSGNASKTRDHEGNEELLTVHKVFSKVCSNPNFLQNPTPAHLPSQARKTTKIPRCHPLSNNLKRQHFGKEYELPNKTHKRKSFENDCEESDTNFSRRKTYVLKSNNVLKNSESIQNLQDANDSLLKQKLALPDDRLILSNDKRKTFVLKSNNMIKEPEPVCLNMIDNECESASQNNVNETTNVQGLITSEKNKRKTFVKKSNNETVSDQNDAAAEYQVSFPIIECAINLESIENCKNSDQSKNITSFSDCPDSRTIENRQTFAESSNIIKQNSEIRSYSINMMSDVSLKENDKISTTNETGATDKTKVIAENPKSTTNKTDATDKTKIIVENPKSITNETVATNKAKIIAVNPKSKVECVVQNQVASKGMEKDFDFMNEEVVNDKSLKIENDNEILECIASKIPNSLFESSDSEIDLIIVDEIKTPVTKTPIRRRISRNSRKKKFVFDFNKRKSVLKNQSSSKILNSEMDDNCCQNNAETLLSDMNTINNREVEVIKIRQTDDALLASEKSAKFSSEVDTVRKISKSGASKIKINQDAPIKNTKKNVTKGKKNKKLDSDIQIDDLISKPKKIRKKNIKKKKNEDINTNDDAISKFVEVDKIVKLNHVEASGKELESDFPCKKTGENTFLVQAEIHPPPPFSNTIYNGKMKLDDKLNFQNKQLVVVLNDVLKSKSIALLNISNRDILCDKNVSAEFPLPNNSSSFIIDPEESIEKLRCDPVPETDDLILNCDEILDIESSKAPSNPIPHIENARPGRRRRPVNYKEPNLHQKIRRS